MMELNGIFLWTTIGNTFGGIITSFIKTLFDVIFSLFFCSVELSTERGGNLLVERIGMYVCNNMTCFQGQTYSLVKNWDKTNKEPETLISGLRTQLPNGTKVFYYEGRKMWVTTTEKGNQRMRNTKSVVINSFRWNFPQVKKFIEQQSEKKMRPGVMTYMDRYWECTHSVPNRKTYISNGPHEDALINYIREFINSEQKYKDAGRKYKMGFMLEGPPGVGKTSFVEMIAHLFGLSIYTLSGIKSTDRLMKAINDISCPGQYLVYVDDFDGDDTLKTMDAVDEYDNDDEDNGHSRSKKKKAKAEGPKKIWQGLLDGLCSPDGAIFGFGTNHPEKIDPIMTRDCRIDIRVKMKYATPEWVKGYFLQAYENKEAEADRLVSQIHGIEIKQATVSRVIFYCKGNVSASDAVDKLVAELKPKTD